MVPVGARLPALLPVRLAPGLEPNHPIVELLAPAPQRLFEGLVRARDVAVEGHGDIDENCHLMSFLFRFGYQDGRAARNSSKRA